ncbi:MAG: SdiA-regulated domain-containing protein [Bacteroidia bacterium]|nr:SdiA-regulated domain-containing protein [Bacteroidia bacterium]
MTKAPVLLIFSLCFSLIASCQTGDKQTTTPIPDGQIVADSLRGVFPYHLDNPSRSYELPTELIEISGMALASDGALLLVQDEVGIVFRLEPLTGAVAPFIRFAGDGDFEGITRAGDSIWALRSDGKLYRFMAQASEDAVDLKWEPAIPDGGDYESMTFQPCCDRILVAGKEPISLQGPAHDRYRTILAFPIANPDQFSIAYQLDLKAVSDYLDQYATAENLSALKSSFDPSKKSSFKPSAMAVHPQSGDLYVLASVGKLLLVYTEDGALRHVRSLREDLFPQPEGMCFGSDGTLYISHEGKGGKGRIHVFPTD